MFTHELNNFTMQEAVLTTQVVVFGTVRSLVLSRSTMLTIFCASIFPTGVVLNKTQPYGVETNYSLPTFFSSVSVYAGTDLVLALRCGEKALFISLFLSLFVDISGQIAAVGNASSTIRARARAQAQNVICGYHHGVERYLVDSALNGDASLRIAAIMNEI